ncbi:MAG: hypothetical protein Q7S87_10125 [Agitococcus sp.]|nr:hypothetical protein [Agitococcus sp.]MDO9179316.1 hypothetical protein [Agitococcus sp.]
MYYFLNVLFCLAALLLTILLMAPPNVASLRRQALRDLIKSPQMVTKIWREGPDGEGRTSIFAMRKDGVCLQLATHPEVPTVSMKLEKAGFVIQPA